MKKAATIRRLCRAARSSRSALLIGFIFNALMKCSSSLEGIAGHTILRTKVLRAARSAPTTTRPCSASATSSGPKIAGLDDGRRRALVSGPHPDHQILRRRGRRRRSHRRSARPSPKWAPDEVRGAYVLYIGAGAVAMAGMISLARSLPTIWHGLKGGLADLRGGNDGAKAQAAADRSGPLDEMGHRRRNRL